MPKTRRTRRSVKSKPKRRKTTRNPYAKTNQRLKNLAPRPLSWSTLYRTQNTLRDQTILKIVETKAERSVFYGVDPSKINSVTNLFQLNSSGTLINLQQCFEIGTDIGPSNYMPEYVNFAAAFRYVKFMWIKITLTPLKYDGTQPSISQDEHPTLHYINDDGSAALGLVPSNTYTIAKAETLPSRQYGTRYFNQPYEFKISTVTKNATDKGAPNAYSMQTWCETAVANGTEYVPADNFYYGFSNVPANFKYAIKVRACVVGKDLLLG